MILKKKRAKAKNLKMMGRAEAATVKTDKNICETPGEVCGDLDVHACVKTVKMHKICHFIILHL